MYKFYINTVGISAARIVTAATVSTMIAVGLELCKELKHQSQHELLTLIFEDGTTYQRIETIHSVEKYLTVLNIAYNAEV